MELKIIYDILIYYAEVNPTKQDALVQKAEGHWVKYSIQEYKNIVDNLAIGLYALGIEKGDIVATMSNNSPQWNFVDMATAKLGAIHVSVYSNLSDEDTAYILNHSEAKIIFAGEKEFYQKIKRVYPSLDIIPLIFTFDEIPQAHNFDEIIALGTKRSINYEDKVEKIFQSLNENDIRSIIYTSGTTGMPKGVMLSHKNFLSNVKAASSLLPLESDDRIISFLPISHVLERMLIYLFQYKQVSIYYAESVEKLVSNIQELEPSGFGAVPRLIEKVYGRIEQKQDELKGIKKILYKRALKLAERYEENGLKSSLDKFWHAIYDKLIYSQWRKALGGNIKLILVGGAALQPRLARAFRAAGIKLSEGYGLSETSPVVAVNGENFPEIKFGTVGPILPGVEVKIAEDKEILIKGPNVMLGYYKDEKATKAVFTPDGWFKSGDIGEMIENKFLKITDRKKEIFKLSTGLYIAPQVIENICKKSELIDQIMILGENEKFVAALIVPDFKVLTEKAIDLKIRTGDHYHLVQQQEIIQLFDREIAAINMELSKIQQIKKFRITANEWSVDSGELSPTLKLKREVIKSKYNDFIKKIYT
jgi:long-chain acyl-CoA synthetase